MPMNSKRRVPYDVIIVGSFPPPHGGQAVHIEELFRHLQRSGLAVMTLNTGVNKEVDVQGVRNVTSSVDPLRALVFDYEAELVHVHAANPDEFGKLLPVSVAAAVRQFKCVMTIHSGNVEAALRQVGAWRRWLSKSILHRLDRVICVNETTRKLISSWTASRTLKTIPAYSMQFSERRPPEHIEAFLQRHDPLISCVGFFEPTYGFDLAIRAIERLAASHDRIGLLIMGTMHNASEYAAMIRDRQLDDHVLLCGNLDRDTCLSIIRRSSLFVRPTLYDGDSISVREALALGTPVVASDTEFRPAGVTLFKRGDLEDMIEKLALLLRKRPTAVTACERDTANLEAVARTYSDVLGENFRRSGQP